MLAKGSAEYVLKAVMNPLRAGSGANEKRSGPDGEVREPDGCGGSTV